MAAIHQPPFKVTSGERVSWFTTSEDWNTSLINGVSEIDAEDINSLRRAVEELRTFALPAKMIFQCGYCTSWGVDGFHCPKCGAPIKRKENGEQDNESKW